MCRNYCRRPASAARCTPWWARDSWRRCSSPSPRTAGATSRRRRASRSTAAARSAPSASSSGLDQDLLRLQDVLAELRRQLKPLQQQAEMAKKHETLTAKAEELSRKLAAARLRALLREQDRRRSGWDEGLERRQQARELLDTLDTDVLAAADDPGHGLGGARRGRADVPPDPVGRIAGAGGLPRRGGAGRRGPRSSSRPSPRARPGWTRWTTSSAGVDEDLARVIADLERARTRAGGGRGCVPRRRGGAPTQRRRPAARWARRPPAAARRSRRCSAL